MLDSFMTLLIFNTIFSLIFFSNHSTKSMGSLTLSDTEGTGSIPEQCYSDTLLRSIPKLTIMKYIEKYS